MATTQSQGGCHHKGWRWHLQSWLFTALRAAGHAIQGGNLSRADGCAIANQGHCGQLKPERLPNMRLAQRARDAAMARALLAASRPAILLAGNGHVRRDYGVPTLLQTANPAARIVSVGFIESLDEAPAGAFDYLWITAPPPQQRPDPCQGMSLPK